MATPKIPVIKRSFETRTYIFRTESVIHINTQKGSEICIKLTYNQTPRTEVVHRMSLSFAHNCGVVDMFLAHYRNPDGFGTSGLDQTDEQRMAMLHTMEDDAFEYAKTLFQKFEDRTPHYAHWCHSNLEVLTADGTMYEQAVTRWVCGELQDMDEYETVVFKRLVCDDGLDD